MKINNTVLDVLGNCRVEENLLYLPANLDRKVYTEVNKVLEALGGKWNRKAGGHVFDRCPADEIDDIILTGEYTDKKKEYQFFPTPPEIAEKLCDFAGINENTTVLEPSCGKGNIADAVWKRNPKRLLGIELNKEMAQYLEGKPYEVITGQDFLLYESDAWDRIVMNPPFSRQQDIDHVLKAHSLLAEGGILVSVMSVSFQFRTNRKSEEFRDFLDSVGASVYDLPEGAFKESGTMIRSCIVVIRK